MTGRELPEKSTHIVAGVPAYPVFGTLFSARLGWLVAQWARGRSALADLTLSFGRSIRTPAPASQRTGKPLMPSLIRDRPRLFSAPNSHRTGRP